jgi:hypothetical protein
MTAKKDRASPAFNAPLIQIGVSTQTVKEVYAAIIGIITADASDAVKIPALETLRTACNVNGTTVSNCNLGMSMEKQSEDEE